MKKQQVQAKAKAKTTEKQSKLNQNSNDRYYPDLLIDEDAYLRNNYKVVRELGRGGYGVVYKGYAYHNGQEDKTKKYAIKVNFSTVSPELIFAEIGFLKLVQGKENLPQLVNLFLTNQKIYIVTEYFSFDPFITFFSTFNMQQIKDYLRELLKALLVLKQNGIYHRDVKPGNFLYNPKIKKGILIDYGLSEIDKSFVNNMLENGGNTQELRQRKQLYEDIMKTISQIGHNKIGTESFMPLESILHYQEQSYEVDIWAVGVIFLQFLTRKYNLFSNVRMVHKPAVSKNLFYVNFILELTSLFGAEAITKICNKFGYYLNLPSVVAKTPINWRSVIHVEGFDDKAEDLLTQLLELDPQKRIKVEDALQHPFFEQ
ncbi:unnamed protein product [Paramecium primaurelia]|uniref:non-specific serine/threonine protein kinase n=1 Tax=Paramecium primaurelia TaxID=5886 RepID=A0A8S1NNS5_PARPR|nr:unnamed protein product [Paramecium primaurelia]